MGEKNKVAKSSLRQEIAGTIFEGILAVTDEDIKVSRFELESNNTIGPGEIYIGKMDEREIRVIAYVFKAKKTLISLIESVEGPVTNEKNDWSLPNKLSKDIKFAQSWLNYLITNRLVIPNNANLIFKKDFQIIVKPEENYRQFGLIHSGQEE